MKLTGEQIQQIDDYIFSCGIKWVDVRAELVDHFATSLENKLDETTKLDFKQMIVNEHKSFSDVGFKKLLEIKKKAVEKQFYKQVFKHLKSFVKLPKVIISVSVFYVLTLIMNYISNKEYFFEGLTAILFLVVIVLFIRIAIEKRAKKESFLILNRTNFYLQLFNLLVILFSSTTNFRTEGSYSNITYNYIHLGIFVLLLLFYWSSEYVFFMNKKYVQKQYPQIAI